MPCIDPRTVKPKWYDNPKSMRPDDTHRTYAVPCGRCEYCLKERVKEWTFRLRQEERASQSAFFVTLTYAPQHVPISECGRLSLDDPKRWNRPEDYVIINRGKNKGKKKIRDDHFTKFMKTLRSMQTKDKDTPKDAKKIRFYMAAEYGDLYERPHYHVILFNVYNYGYIQTAWPHGAAYIEKDPKHGAFAYCVKYLQKKGKVPKYEGDTRKPEYSRQSLGIGKVYLNKQTENYHKSDLINHNHITTEQGHKIKMPRYYSQKLYNSIERLILADVKADTAYQQDLKQANDRNMTLEQYRQSKREGLIANQKTITSPKRIKDGQ